MQISCDKFVFAIIIASHYQIPFLTAYFQPFQQFPPQHYGNQHGYGPPRPPFRPFQRFPIKYPGRLIRPHYPPYKRPYINSNGGHPPYLPQVQSYTPSNLVVTHSTTPSLATTTPITSTTQTITTAKPVVKLISAISTTKKPVNYIEDNTDSMLAGLVKDGTLKSLGLSKNQMQVMLKEMWPAYKKATDAMLDKDKTRKEMLFLKMLYHLKKNQWRKLNHATRKKV